MKIFAEFYQETWFIIVMIVLAVILAVFLLVVLTVFIAHSSARRQVKELENRYNAIHDYFSTDCSNMIKRIESISKQNATYVQIFDSVKARFAVILKENDKQCYIAVDSLKKLIGDKNYRDIRNVIDSTKSSMEEFSKASAGLTGDLQNLLKPDDECSTMSIALKEKFRALKEKYDNNSTALESISSSFNILFTHITDMFEKFSEYLNVADYSSAKKILPDIERLIDAADKIMGEIPTLNTLTDKVIPKRIQELTDTFHEMEKTYPLHHLMLNQAIEEMRNKVEMCSNKLKNLDISHVQETLDKIGMDINEYFNDFDKEKEAKRIFDTKQIDIDSSTYQCEKQYANLTNMLPSYCRYYQIDQTYLKQISAIKDMIDSMSSRKRTLDSYINSSTKQPYSMLVTTINDLEIQVKAIQKAFDGFHEYLKELKADTERAYAFVRQAYDDVLFVQYELRIVSLEAENGIIAPRIQQAINYITALDKNLKILPIDVMKLNSDYQEAHMFVEKLMGDMKENMQNMKRAEELIVYTNTLRKDSLEVDRRLQVAETSFIEGDFTRAATTAADIYKTFSTQRK